MRPLKFLGRIFSVLLTILLVLLLACNMYLAVSKSVLHNDQPTVFGYTAAVVVSGSMSGTIEIDDMVIIHHQDSYAVGDIITFRSGQSAVTHRIVGETEQGFITQGDANNAADIAPVAPEQIIGRVEQVIPNIGVLIYYMRSPLGLTCLVLTGVLLIEFPALVDWMRARNRRKLP